MGRREKHTPESEQQPGYYGTGRRPQEKSQLPLIVGLLALVLAVNVMTLTVRLEGAREPQDASGETVTAPPEPVLRGEKNEDSRLHIKDAGEALDAAQLYQKVNPCMATVTAESGTGSESGRGLVLTDDGYILTSFGLVENAYRLTVTLSDGTVLNAQGIGADTATELAVVKIAAESTVAAELGDSGALQAGDLVYTVDGDCAASHTVLGFSAEQEYFGVRTRRLQVDGTVTGVLFNASGQAVAICMDGLGEDSKTTALPIDSICVLTSDLFSYGCVRTDGSLGMTVSDIGQAERRYWNLPEGVVISQVAFGGNAYAAGVRRGDVLIAVDDQPVMSKESYRAAVMKYKSGDALKLTLYRSGEQIHLELELREID